MKNTFLTSIKIKKVRHLHDISIPLSCDMRKHLILTGKNGSGKTSVLDALAKHFHYIVDDSFMPENKIQEYIKTCRQYLPKGDSESEKFEQESTKERIAFWEKSMENWTIGAIAPCTSYADLRQKYANGEFIFAYYKADRLAKVEISSTIENIQLKEQYALSETPGSKLVKYMVGLKATQAFAGQKGNQKRAAEIDAWFERFENILKRIFDDPSLRLDFDIDNFRFHIIQKNREPFDFNTMSSGYSAVFDIINDLIMRMERTQNYLMEGVVLIDEIETHLHLELQRIVLPFLTEMFPNIQFIVTSHSPFILSSIENAAIYDLETQKLVENGLANYPYEGIVEGYFHADVLSEELREKLNRYRELVKKQNLTDEDYAEAFTLEQELDEIPDFLSPDIAAEYSRMKLEFSNRG